jgi:hypothetical protein
MSAASLPEWAEAVSAALMLSGSTASVFFLTVDADPADFNPMPGMRRAVESGRYDPALIAVANARHATRETAARARILPRDTAITAAALLMLLSSEASR